MLRGAGATPHSIFTSNGYWTDAFACFGWGVRNALAPHFGQSVGSVVAAGGDDLWRMP